MTIVEAQQLLNREARRDARRRGVPARVYTLDEATQLVRLGRSFLAVAQRAPVPDATPATTRRAA